MDNSEPVLVPLDVHECLRRLGTRHLGRLAVVVNRQPLVFPVNYAMDGREVVFRTGAGTKLIGANGQRVAFEIDGADPLYHEGWSVMAVGRAVEECDAARIRELERLPLAPWCPGSNAHWMRIETSAITGRRIARLPTVVREMTTNDD